MLQPHAADRAAVLQPGARCRPTTRAATNPVVQLTGWGGGPQISCPPTSVDFGQTLTHSTSTVPVLCTNTGTALPGTALIIDPPTASPSVFYAQFDPSKDVYPLNGLAPGRTAQIDVSYPRPPPPTTRATSSSRATAARARPSTFRSPARASTSRPASS